MSSRLGNKFQTFMCNGVAARLAADVEFNAQLEKWFGRLGNKFQTFICDSVAKRLSGPESSKFISVSIQMIDTLKLDNFILLYKNGVAYRICDDVFRAKLLEVHQTLSTEERKCFFKFFGLGVARIRELGVDKFWTRVVEICKMVPVPTQKRALELLKE